MTGVLEGVRDYAQSHPLSVAAGVFIAITGTYLYLTGRPISCAVGRCSNAPSAVSSPPASFANGISVYDSQHPLDVRLSLPVSRWSDKPAPASIVRVLRGTRKSMLSSLTSVATQMGISQDIVNLLDDRWASHFPPSRFAAVAITTALPGAFLIFVRHHPGSWAARHQTKIANALHVFAVVTAAGQKISIQDLLVTALVMVSFEALQRTLYHDSGQSSSAAETLLSHTVADSDIAVPSKPRNATDKDAQVDGDPSPPLGEREDEIARLQKTLTEAKTTQKVQDHDLRRTQSELHNARETLDETFAEYTSLRDEMKTMKQTLGRDHQAVIYRKDIELFALRKANEQKENYMKERDSKLEEIYRQQKAALELKDAQLRNLKERIAFLERQASPQPNGEIKVDSAVEGDEQAAVQVRLLRVKGRSSLEVESAIQEKEVEIAKLKLDLASAVTAADGLEKTQDELRRAWDATYEVQCALNEERKQHAQTQTKLQEAAIRLDEFKMGSAKNSPTTRLPTIEEQDKKELEAMFNTAQQDNLRLYSDVEALDKRVREANARVFTAEQEAEALREQLRLEKAINDDMGTARPSIVHRVHFQRMEGQLKESRDALGAKEEEIEQLKKSSAEKDSHVEGLKKDNDAAATTQTQLQEENARLKQSIAQLEVTKEQLMLDHERLAQHRARQRNSSAEQHHSARSSGATLITEPITITNMEEPMPARPLSIDPTESSIRGTPERHLRSDNTNRFSLISNDVPPAELRSSRRKSLTLKGLMRKITRRDDDADEGKSAKSESKEREKEKDKERPKTAALAPKDKNALMRPKTAALPTEPASKKDMHKAKAPVEQRPKTSAAPSSKEAKKSAAPGTRYYEAPQSATDKARPKTSAAAAGDKENEGVATGVVDSPRPKSRGWGASSRKLVRKSVA